MYQDLLNKNNQLAVIGLGYVGLPIALAFAKKIKVIGFDNSPVATRSVPALSSIHQPTRELGAAVAGMLVAALNGSEVTKKMLPVKLVARESTAKS